MSRPKNQVATSRSPQVQLTRNLRRNIMRGHPWVYKDAVRPPLSGTGKAQLCEVIDSKQDGLAWAIYDPHSVLALRILSTQRSSPNEEFYRARFAKALRLRASVRSDKTTAYRLFNGEGDLLPGLVCDIYNNVAVLQFDGQGPDEFWDKELVSTWLLENAGVTSVVEKMRRHSQQKGLQKISGAEAESRLAIQEHGARFWVDIERGQKTGFFLDQRENRKYVQETSKGKSVLNMFSYSGGFSVYAGLGQATQVASLDIAEGAIAMAQENWELNGLNPNHHTGIAEDVFKYLEGDRELWDSIIVDPPSMGHSEEQKDRALQKYIELFQASAKKVKPQGDLFLSSCSSHISFEDFFVIIEEALSGARRKGQILRVSGQGADHPFPHVCPELRYLKFVHLALD